MLQSLSLLDHVNETNILHRMHRVILPPKFLDSRVLISVGVLDAAVPKQYIWKKSEGSCFCTLTFDSKVIFICIFKNLHPGLSNPNKDPAI